MTATWVLLIAGGIGVVISLVAVVVTYHVVRRLRSAAMLWLPATIAAAILWRWDASAGSVAAALVVVCLGPLVPLLLGPSLRGIAADWPEVERRHAMPVASEIDLTVVVPFYNPGADVLHRHLAQLVDALERERVRFEVIAVSDGSTDGSDELAQELEDRGVHTVVLGVNQGKGAALRAGLQRGRGRYLGFIDADGDIPAEMWHEFLALLTIYDADIVVGSKRHPLSDVRYPWLRRVYSRVFQSIVHMLFRVDVTDTQTGIKMFRRELLADVLPLLVENGFVLDLELLAVARRRGWRRVLEAPVALHHHFTSTISFRSVVRMLRDVGALAVRLHVTRRYDVPAVGAPALPAYGGAETMLAVTGER